MYKIDTSLWGCVKAALYIIAAFVGAGLDYIEVSHKLVITLSALMVLDWITGSVKAWRLKIPVTSKKAHKGLIEKTALLIIPVAVGYVFKVIDIPLGVTVQTVFSLLIVTELFSFTGNCYCIYSGEDTKELDASAYVIKWLRNKLKQLIKRLLNIKPNDTTDEKL